MTADGLTGKLAVEGRYTGHKFYALRKYSAQLSLPYGFFFTIAPPTGKLDCEDFCKIGAKLLGKN